MRRLLVNLSLGLASLALTLLLLEGAARLFAAAPRAALFSDPDARIRGRSFVEHHERLGFALEPGSYERQGRTILVNGAGFRGREPSGPPGRRFTILALGDSTTFGWRVGEGEDYPSQLARSLARRGAGDVSVVNAGVPSYTSRQVRLYLEEILEGGAVEPDLVLVGVLWNDIWYASLPNWYPELLVHQKPDAWRLFLFQHSRLVRVLLYRDTAEPSRADVFNERALDHYVQNLEEIAELCAARELALAFVAAPFDLDHVAEDGVTELRVRYSPPFLIEVARTFERAVRELARRRALPFIDHSLSLGQLHQRPLFLDFIHPTAEGNRIIAEDVARALVEAGLTPRARARPE